MGSLAGAPPHPAEAPGTPRSTDHRHGAPERSGRRPGQVDGIQSPAQRSRLRVERTPEGIPGSSITGSAPCLISQRHSCDARARSRRSSEKRVVSRAACAPASAAITASAALCTVRSISPIPDGDRSRSSRATRAIPGVHQRHLRRGEPYPGPQERVLDRPTPLQLPQASIRVTDASCAFRMPVWAASTSDVRGPHRPVRRVSRAVSSARCRRCAASRSAITSARRCRSGDNAAGFSGQTERRHRLAQPARVRGQRVVAGACRRPLPGNALRHPAP